jgi:hypothetical protein
VERMKISDIEEGAKKRGEEEKRSYGKEIEQYKKGISTKIREV